MEEAQMDTWIKLPFGGRGAGFQVRDLVAHIKTSGRDYIIEGAQKDVLAEHRKPHSLDYWLRTHATSRSDTMQMVTEVEAALVTTGLFRSAERRCPQTGRKCKALELTDAAKG
jgi:hypothetical protein